MYETTYVNVSKSNHESSKELVEVINAIRKQEGNNVEIQHGNLMQRIKGFEHILGALAIQSAEYLGNNA